MIASLRGIVLERYGEGTVLIEVNGVGYLVSVTPRTLAELEPTSTVFVHIHHHIREDAQTLYGFLTRDERATFLDLIATHGVGPALALAVLGTHTPNALVDIVASNDVAALTLVPGVGKKTAERVILDLRDKVGIAGGPAGNGAVATGPRGGAREGLVALGFPPDQVDAALAGADADLDGEALIRTGLAVLGR